MVTSIFIKQNKSKYILSTIWFLIVFPFSAFGQTTPSPYRQLMFFRFESGVMTFGKNSGSLSQDKRTFGGPIGFSLGAGYGLVYQDRLRIDLNCGLRYTQNREKAGYIESYEGVIHPLYVKHFYPMFMASLEAGYRVYSFKKLNIDLQSGLHYVNVWISKLKWDEAYTDGNTYPYDDDPAGKLYGKGYYATSSFKVSYNLAKGHNIYFKGSHPWGTSAELTTPLKRFSTRFPSGAYWTAGIEILLHSITGKPFEGGQNQ